MEEYVFMCSVLYCCRVVTKLGVKLTYLREITQFQRNYYKSLYCDFVMYSDLETWSCT